MRLASVLSKDLETEFVQIEPFIDKLKYCEFEEDLDDDLVLLMHGDFVQIEIGKISLNYFCEECEDIRSFISYDKLHCLVVSNELISVDCELSCPVCNASMQVWFLIEVDDIFASAPMVRVIKRTEKLNDKVALLTRDIYGEHTESLENAMRAFKEGFGAGSIVYLRKVFESIIIRTAQASSPPIDTLNARGKKLPFKHILDKVKEQSNVIPNEFSEDGYKLFGELSDVVHGEYDEVVALEKFNAFYRLVIGVTDNVKNNRELMQAIGELGWDSEGGTNE